MARGIGDRGAGALADAEQDEGLAQAGGVDHRLEVCSSDLQCKFANLPITQAATALVVAHVVVVPGEEAQPVAPDRTVRVVVEVGQPGCRAHQRQAMAAGCPGKAHAGARGEQMGGSVHRFGPGANPRAIVAEGKMTGAFSDLPGKSMQKDGATRLIPPASFNWYCFGMLLQQRLEARVVADRVPDGMDPQQ